MLPRQVIQRELEQGEPVELNLEAYPNTHLRLAVAPANGSEDVPDLSRHRNVTVAKIVRCTSPKRPRYTSPPRV